jgi:hypothetical protein
MSDIKCGQQGYKGPKCKIKDFDPCDELEAGAKLTELFPGKSKKYQQNKLGYIDKQARNDSFWLVNNEATGVCWNDAWYLYEVPKQVVSSQTQPVAKEKDFFEKAEGLFEDVGDFFDRTIKDYQKKGEKVKEEGVGPQSIVGNFWKEIAGTLGAIALIVTVKVLRSKSKKAKAEAVAAKGRREQDARRKAAEPKAEPTLGSQRFADEAPLPLTRKTPTPTPVPAAVAETVEEPVFELSRPPSEPPVSEQSVEGRAPVGLGLSKDSAKPLAGQESPTVAVDYERKTTPGDYSAQTTEMPVQNGQSEVSQSSRPTVGLQSESSAMPPKEASPEFDDTGVNKMAGVMSEPDVIVIEALVDIDPGGEISTLRTFENEYDGITMSEKTLKRTAIIVYEEVFSRPGYDDYSTVLEAIVHMSFEKAVKDKQGEVDVEHAKKACLEFMGIKGEEALAEFDTAVQKGLAKYKLWINRGGRSTFGYGQKWGVSADKANGHSNGARQSDSSLAPRPTGSVRSGSSTGTSGEKSLTVSTAAVRYPQFPSFKSMEYWKLARESLTEYVGKDIGFSNVWGIAEDRLDALKTGLTTVLHESTETVAEKFFNRQEGVTRAGAEAAARKSTSISNGSSKAFYIAGLDPIPAVTDLYNEADVDAMVDKAMDQDAELKGLQSFERAEYKANVMTAMKEMPGFEADFVRDGKITPKGVKEAIKLCAAKKGSSGSGIKAEQKVEMREDKTKAEFEKFELSPADWDEIESNAKKLGKKK